MTALFSRFFSYEAIVCFKIAMLSYFISKGAVNFAKKAKDNGII